MMYSSTCIHTRVVYQHSVFDARNVYEDGKPLANEADNVYIDYHRDVLTQ